MPSTLISRVADSGLRNVCRFGGRAGVGGVRGVEGAEQRHDATESTLHSCQWKSVVSLGEH